MNNDNTANQIEKLNLSNEEYRVLIARLESRTTSVVNGCRRDQDRRPLAEDVIVIFQAAPVDDNRAPGLHQVRCRNISPTGIALFNGFMLTKGTACTLTLLTADRQGFRIPMTVARCRKTRDNLFEIGAKFDQPADLTGLLPAEDEEGAAI